MPTRIEYVGRLEGSGILIDDEGHEHAVEFRLDRGSATATLYFHDAKAAPTGKLEDAVLLTEEQHSALLQGQLKRQPGGTVQVPIIG